jgi:hypothetical protein
MHPVIRTRFIPGLRTPLSKPRMRVFTECARLKNLKCTLVLKVKPLICDTVYLHFPLVSCCETRQSLLEQILFSDFLRGI